MQAHGHVQNSTEKDPTQAVTPYCSGLYICLTNNLAAAQKTPKIKYVDLPADNLSFPFKYQNQQFLKPGSHWPVAQCELGQAQIGPVTMFQGSIPPTATPSLTLTALYRSHSEINEAPRSTNQTANGDMTH